MADYNLEGERWGDGALGTSGGVVTWAVDPTVPAAFLDDIRKAFADWSSHGDIQFQEVASTAAAQIDFDVAPIDGASDVLGTTNFSYSGSSLKSATVQFDSGEGWRVSGSKVVSGSGVDLFEVALHEVGHAIGLDHYNTAPAVMNAVLNPAVTDLTASDIDGVTALYGAPPGASSDPLVDAAFYLGHNPDVAAAKLDPAVHYDTFGWHEGRNPDAFFSTNGYLNDNPDVKASGVDPLSHYEQYGWKEGRDPSATFSTALYLQDNPDVKAAGLDPLQHFLRFGQAEGRTALPAIGHGGEIGDFDPHYYLLANPDVAAAADATSDPDQFAYQHFETYGWHEGRNPDAYFDTKAYLANNKDVAASGLNPLTHYEEFGWHEDRDPSAAFDTAGYLAANPDVKAAGVDPLQHFLTYGAWEGRSA